MTPFVRSVGALAYGTGALNVPLPSGYHVDDILVLVIATAYGEGIGATGWAHAPDSPAQSGVGGVRLNVLWRRATGSESAFTTDSGDHQVARIIAVGDCIDSGSPWDVTNAGFTGTAVALTVPGDTTTQNDDLVLVAVGVAQLLDQEGFISGWTNADLTSITEVFDNVKNVGSGGGIALITGEKAVAGAVGSTTATQQAAGAYVGWFGALKVGTGSGSTEGTSSTEAVSSEEPDEPPDEFENDHFAISTWQWDTPEDDPVDRDPIPYFLAWSFEDEGVENVDKRITAIRITAKGSDLKVQVHGPSAGDVISVSDIEKGLNARAEVTFPDSSAVTRFERRKVNVRRLSMASIRFSGVWDGLGIRDRLDELLAEGEVHGTKK